MDFTKQKEYWEQAGTKKSSVALAKYLSLDVWLRLKMVRHFSSEMEIGVREVTLTENLVFEIAKFQELTNTKLFKLEEAKNEAKNGADLLLNIQFGKKGYLSFPIQAKKLDTDEDLKDGYYYYYNHKNKNGYQKNLLIKYANELGSNLPLFLFYNYTSGNKQFTDSFHTEPLYGCSVAEAKKVTVLTFNGNAPKFSEIHPKYGFPFHELFELFDDGNDGGNQTLTPLPNSPFKDDAEKVIEFYKKLGREIDLTTVEKLKFQTEEELSEGNWTPIKLDNLSKCSARKNGTLYRITLISTPISDSNEESLSEDVGELDPDEIKKEVNHTKKYKGKPDPVLVG